MKIAKVRTFLATADSQGSPLFAQPWRLTPSSIFYEERHRNQTGKQKIGELVVEITTDEGVTGLGTVGAARGNALHTIQEHLAPILIGESPFDVELLWERMYRHTVKFGRKGMVVEAISGVDIALWDLMGKATGQPLYNLLGGRTRDRIRLYASKLYPTENLDRLAEEARSYVQQGNEAASRVRAAGRQARNAPQPSTIKHRPGRNWPRHRVSGGCAYGLGRPILYQNDSPDRGCWPRTLMGRGASDA
jgi:hypothetical protein